MIGPERELNEKEQAALREELRRRFLIAGLKHTDAGALLILWLEEGLVDLETDVAIPEPWFRLGQIQATRKLIEALKEDFELEQEEERI